MAGSGTAFSPGAVICPLPEVARVARKLGAGLPEGAMNTVVGVAKPVAPRKDTCAAQNRHSFRNPKHVKVCPRECVGSPVEGGGEIERYRGQYKAA